MNAFEWERRKLAMRRLPRRLWCFMSGGHRYGGADPVIVDGPIDLPLRDRDWHVIGVHRQCEKCYHIDDLPYTEAEAAKYIEDAIREDGGA